jgi:putative CocE/NonD family hydrolase
MLPQFWHTADFMPETMRYENILMHLPLKDGDLKSAGHPVPHYRNWITHQSYDKYWKSISDEERFDQIVVPSHTLGGWFDIFIQGTINGYVGMKNHGATTEARQGARMIIGPWGHGSSQTFGGVDFTPEAELDFFALQLRFYDYHLKGIDNGLNDEPPVKLFYMGINQWRNEADWPIPGTEYRNLYLTSESTANAVRGDGKLSFKAIEQQGHDSYTYDPKNPVPTIGGNNCCGTPTQAGPRDQRPLERRNDVLVYTSDFLDEPLTVAGPIRIHLEAATDGRDTDWMVKLVDVYPDGYAMPISEGIIRARFREGLDQMKLLEPGKVYPYDIEMTGTANVFQKGHRIRVDITSSNFPQFDRNPNTGEDLGAGIRMRVANQTIHHGGKKSSYLVLPIVPSLE